MQTSLKPWFEEYKIHGIPQTLMPYPLKPTHALLDEAAVKYKKMGFVQMGYCMPYPEAKDKADRLANALAAMGVKKGDRVATLLPTSIQFVLADSAISKAGAVHVPCSFLEPPDHLEHKFKKSSPKVVFTLDEYMPMVDGLGKKVEIAHVIVSKLADFSSSRPSEPPALGNGVSWLTDILDAYPAQAPRIQFSPKEDIETLLFTGGTTGLPKGCMLSHFNIMANAVQNSIALGISSQILKGNVAMLIATPFFHSYGHCILHTMTGMGMMQLLVPDARDTRSMVEMIKEHHPIMAIGVPTQFMKMVDEELKGVGILGLSGSAALPPETQEQFEKKGAGALMEGYGLSEMSPVTHLNASVMIRLFGGRKMVALNSKILGLPGQIPLLSKLLGLLGYRNVGKIFNKAIPRLSRFSKRPSRKKEEKRATIGIPLPDTEIKIIEVDTQKEIPIEEVIKGGRLGEMLLNGPQRMLGYWPDKGKGFDEEGFIHTGDVVKVDEKGYFYIVDRTKDMIIVSGYKVYSRELDDILYDHPAVAMAATIGVPDAERPGSEVVKVCIQLKPEFVGKVDEEEIISYLRKKVAKYAVPKGVVFLENMPLTEVQKVNKKYLRERESGIK